MLLEFDTPAISGNQVPFLCMVTAALMASSATYCHFQSRYPEPAETDYQAFGLLDKVINHVANALRIEPSIQAVFDLRRIGNLHLDFLVLAYTVLKIGLTTMVNVCSGAELVEMTVLYKNSELRVS